MGSTHITFHYNKLHMTGSVIDAMTTWAKLDAEECPKFRGVQNAKYYDDVR